MHIIEDSRQKLGKHDAKEEYLQSCGDTLTRCKLPWGDYALAPLASVDTKETIYELAQDIDQDHNRFRNELKNAQEHGCALTILVENEDGIKSIEELEKWNETLQHYQMRLAKSSKARRISGARLAKACRTMSERYGVTFKFTDPESAGRIIREILGGNENGGG